MASDLFLPTGVHCVVDGQFGSTGKGALCAWLAEQALGFQTPFAGAIYSGGPNSGHTSYFGDQKIVLKQLPTFSVHMALHRAGVPAYLSAGAVIDRDILREEAERWPVIVFVHPNAAIVTDEDRREEERGSIAEVAGTRSGTGSALIRKIRREPYAIARTSLGRIAPNVQLYEHRIKPEQQPYFMEVAQGFSLGLNSQFYPKVTSRECTVMQGMADARLPASALARTFMAIRTFPIRVGNVGNYNSGGWYDDQREISWEDIGVEPEITTVTKRIRRVATFSFQQFWEACFANAPDFVFISHLDYIENTLGRSAFVADIGLCWRDMGKPFEIIVGTGPRSKDITRWG